MLKKQAWYSSCIQFQTTFYSKLVVTKPSISMFKVKPNPQQSVNLNGFFQGLFGVRLSIITTIGVSTRGTKSPSLTFFQLCYSGRVTNTNFSFIFHFSMGEALSGVLGWIEVTRGILTWINQDIN